MSRTKDIASKHKKVVWLIRLDRGHQKGRDNKNT